MTPEAWKKKIGDSNWTMLVDAVDRHEYVPRGEIIAEILEKLAVLGVEFPEKAPELSPDGTKLLWPSEDHVGAALTAKGLANYYAAKGHGFFLFRVEQFLKGIAPPSLLARFQEMCVLYEDQCATDGVRPLPTVNLASGGGWRAFVGGVSEPTTASMVHDAIAAESPEPKPTKKIFAAGPGGKAQEM